MAFARYSVRRTVWRIWKWEADYRGEATAHGYRLSKVAARWAARGWLRGRGAASAMTPAGHQPEEGGMAEEMERLS